MQACISKTLSTKQYKTFGGGLGLFLLKKLTENSKGIVSRVVQVFFVNIILICSHITTALRAADCPF